MCQEMTTLGIYGKGGFAEYVVVPAKSSPFLVPDEYVEPPGTSGQVNVERHLIVLVHILP